MVFDNHTDKVEKLKIEVNINIIREIHTFLLEIITRV